MSTYAKGNTITCRTRVNEVQENGALGSLAVPDTLTFKVKTPAGSVTTYVWPTDAEVIEEADGIYRVDVLANLAGDWAYQFSGTKDGLSLANEKGFRIKAGDF